MKKLIAFLAVFCLVHTLWGQSVILSFDARNAFFSTPKGTNGLNLKVSVRDNWNYDSPIHFGMEYEVYSAIDFQQWTFAKLDYRLPNINLVRNLRTFIGVGASQIFHETTYSRDAMCLGVYAEVCWFLSDRIGVIAQAELEQASDIDQDTRWGVFYGLKYKFD